MQPKSNNLFHFTRSLDHLKGIIKEGFYPRYSLEDCSPLGMGHIGYPMVCFCDIPISRISDHTSFYGEYGLGMTKEWGLKNQLAPLLYTPQSGSLAALANFMFSVKSIDGTDSEELSALKQSIQNHFFDLMPMMKPITGTMLIGGKPLEKDFAQENEWRYVPQHDAILLPDKFEEKRDEYNAKVETKKLSFTPADVRYIFVKSDFEIPQVFDFIQSNLGTYPLTDIKILISRITSLETISRDV